MAKLDELPRKGVLKGGFRVKDLGVCYSLLPPPRCLTSWRRLELQATNCQTQVGARRLRPYRSPPVEFSNTLPPGLT